LLGYFPAQVSPVVVITFQDANVPMAREALNGSDVAAR
jgi:hypothetical protein